MGAPYLHMQVSDSISGRGLNGRIKDIFEEFVKESK